MSRIRTVKPEYWTGEQVVSCSPHARLLLIGLWNFCDDNGVHPASYVRLKAEVFPVDNFTLEEVKSWVLELISANLLQEYLVEGKGYWLVTGWKKHQKIDKPNYRHPLPATEQKLSEKDSSTIQETQRVVEEHSTSPRRPFDEGSPTIRRPFDESSGREGKGMESNGKEINNIREAEASPVPVGENGNSASAEVQGIFQHWQQVMKHPLAKLDSKRAGKIKVALKLGYTVEQLKQAIDGCKASDFHQGKNDRGQRYDDISLILRDAEHIERFMQPARVDALDGIGTSIPCNPEIFRGMI